MKDYDEFPVLKIANSCVYVDCGRCNSFVPIQATAEAMAKAFVVGWRKVKLPNRKHLVILCPDCWQRLRGK